MSRRCLGLAVCLVLLLSPFVSLGSALAANGPAGPRAVGNGSGTATPPTAAWADLPAMALTPDDLPGQGYGASSSWLLDLHEYANYNQDNPAAAAKTESAYAGYGFLMSWRALLAVPGKAADGSVANPKQLGQQITQFASAAGAHEGFEAMAAVKQLAGNSTELDAPDLGDEARAATLVTHASSTFNHLNLLIRAGAFVVEIDFAARDAETAPGVDETVLAVAQTLLNRVQQVAARDELGLSQRALRLTHDYTSQTKAYVRYDRLDDRSLLLYKDAADKVDPDATKAPGRAPDVFYVFQYAGDANDGPSLQVHVLRFASASDAEAFVSTRDFSKLANYAELTPSETIGDQTIAASYDHPNVKDGAPHTLSIIVRVGDAVAGIDVNHSESPKLENVEALAKLQAACLTADSPCAPISPDLIANAAS